MIAFLLPAMDFARSLGTQLRSATEEVDGPFRLVVGRLRGVEVRAFAVTGNADAAWAATVLAHRRGAQVVVAVTLGWTTEGLARERGILPDRVTPVGAVLDASALGPALSLLPDSGRSFSFLDSASLPVLWRAEEGDSLPAAATFPWPVRNPWLLRELHRRTGASLGDLQLAGAAAAAGERSIRLVPMVFPAEVLGRRHVSRLPAVGLGEAFDASVAQLLAPWQDT